jgi:Family of unknown function (DUF5335)
MNEPTQVPLDRLQSYFDAFTKRFLLDGPHAVADVEVLGAELGDQRLASDAPLRGVSYDPRGNVLELAFESGDHRVYQPKEVWIAAAPDGFVDEILIIAPDESREIVHIVQRDRPAGP